MFSQSVRSHESVHTQNEYPTFRRPTRRVEVTVWVAGHLGTAQLGAASLTNMTANVTGFCVYEGLATGLDTLKSQAYGASKKQRVGLYVQRMCILSLLATIPVAVAWLFYQAILQILIPEQDLAIMAGQYLRVLLICALGWAIFEAGQRFTQPKESSMLRCERRLAVCQSVCCSTGS
jgi:MATE family multidrug resistance protein